MVAEPALAEEIGGGFRPYFRRRISGHQPAAGFNSSGLEARRPWPHRRWRRRAIDLFLPGGDGPKHSRFSRRLSAPPAEIITLERNYRSTQAILAAANGVIALARERFTKNLWTERQTPGLKAAIGEHPGGGRPPRLYCRTHPREPQVRHPASNTRRCCSGPRITAARLKSN